MSAATLISACGGSTVDVGPPPASCNACADATAPVVYLITTQGILLSFYPPSGEFSRIGTLACPTTTPDDMPFSMAVNHSGTAYVAFFSGSLFEVDTLTAACEATSTAPVPGVFRNQFGMAFSAGAEDSNGLGDAGGPETLFISGSPGRAGSGSPVVLGSLDIATRETTTISVVTPSIYDAELTSGGSGELFAFYQVSPTGTAAAIGRIDRRTGQLVSMSELPGVVFTGGWAFAFWGGDFYTFTAPGGLGTDTVVQRFRPSDGSIEPVATLVGLTVVGAGAAAAVPPQ